MNLLANHTDAIYKENLTREAILKKQVLKNVLKSKNFLFKKKR